MAVTAKIVTTGAGKVLAKLEALSLAGRKRSKVTVGYAANYAVYVHEDLARFHPNGQAKYLEQPTRQYAKDMADIVTVTLKNKEKLSTALERAGQYLLMQSQLLVPVLTGNLRDSGYVRVTS